MLCTWPVFTEAIYFVGQNGGWLGQNALWQLVQRGDLQIASPDDQQLRRSYALMEHYQDVPMDLADASLVALAEAEDLRQIFTLDSHFRAYRLSGNRFLDVVPPA